MYYRKKPVVIEAFQIDYENQESGTYPDWFYDAMKRGYIDYEGGKYHIKTLEGTMTVSQGDYVIKGIQGEIYPCKPDIFLESYEDASLHESAFSLDLFVKSFESGYNEAVNKIVRFINENVVVKKQK